MAAQPGINDRDRASVLDEIAVDQTRWAKSMERRSQLHPMPSFGAAILRRPFLEWHMRSTRPHLGIHEPTAYSRGFPEAWRVDPGG
jgi:hypothetical protein